jgi:hypothetical protein
VNTQTTYPDSAFESSYLHPLVVAAMTRHKQWVLDMLEMSFEELMSFPVEYRAQARREKKNWLANRENARGTEHEHRYYDVPRLIAEGHEW